MAKGTRVLGKHQRVSSESSGAVGDHLAERGSPGESIYENLMSELVKCLTRIDESSGSKSIDEE